MSNQAKGFEAVDFVNCGVRMLRTGKLGLAVRLLIDGALGEELLFAHKRGSGPRVIGGIYTGAEYSAAESQMRGLPRATYKARWEVASDLIEWEAKDGAALTAQRTQKMESEAGRVSELEALLLPLRKLHHTYRLRNDHAGMEALQAAMLRVLRTPPRAHEAQD